MEAGFKLLLADAGVALLHFAEQALFRGEHGACAVDVDGAAFEDDAMVAVLGLDLGLEALHGVVLRDVRGD